MGSTTRAPAGAHRIQVGSGPRPIPGFVNVEPRRIGKDSRKGHAADLSFAPDGTVDVLFNNAVFEHLYVGQQLRALREWKRVLAPEGVVACIGIPDFESIVRRYLAGKDGDGGALDLSDVYRYTHGDPEQGTLVDWGTWRPDRNLDRAPKEWLPQLHKSLFDAATLGGLFETVGLVPTIIRYRHPADRYEITIGAIAGHRAIDPVPALREIPGIEQFVDLDTVRVVEGSWTADPMARRARIEDAGRYGVVERAARRTRRTYRSARAIVSRGLRRAT
jgi:SAM-dependent methyltransferase